MVAGRRQARDLRGDIGRREARSGALAETEGDELIIREAKLEDAFRVREMATRFLLDSQYGALFNNQTTPEAIGSLIENVLRLGAIFVAEVDSGARVPGVCVSIDGEEWHAPGGCETCRPRIVGMLAIVLIPHPLSGQLLAEEIAWWVEPEHRGGSIGPKMLRSAEEWATTNGANMVKMVAPAGSTVGAFYERIGYQAVETAYVKAL
jgi:GNAT superfamily N-acetyltransferase